MQTGAIIRIIMVFTVSAVIIFYNIFSAFGFVEKPLNKPVSDNFLTLEKEPSNQASQLEETKTESEEATQAEEEKTAEKNTETESKQVSAAAVKGKIESRYISPYSAALSYNSVFVKNSSGLSINLKEFLSSPLKYKIEKSDEPQVLIMHTHTTETYVNDDSGVYYEDYTSRTTDNSRNMAEIGRIVAERLNNAGIKALHDTTQHDYPKYSGSYTRAAKTINSYLKKYPSIKIVLDLHRDAISAGGNDKVKLVTEINGKKAAQVMLVMGSQSGTVTNFPNWRENFKLATRLQQTMEVKYPTLARPISLMSKNYNQSLSNGSLLIEFGTDANSLDEAKYSAEMVGESLVTLLNNLS